MNDNDNDIDPMDATAYVLGRVMQWCLRPEVGPSHKLPCQRTVAIRFIVAAVALNPQWCPRRDELLARYGLQGPVFRKMVSMFKANMGYSKRRAKGGSGNDKAKESLEKG